MRLFAVVRLLAGSAGPGLDVDTARRSKNRNATRIDDNWEIRMTFLSPFTGSDNHKFNNTNRFARIVYRWNLYAKVLLASRGKAPVAALVRKQFPFVLRDATAPPAVCIELTNYCNLACTYCSSPLNLRPKGMMAPATFSNLIRQVRDSGIRWVSIVGNGEPTLHPRFPEYIRRLAAATQFVELTTNWQRVDEGLALSILQAPVNLMHVSVDGASKEEYERMRVGGNFENLLHNLTMLKRLKQKTKSTTLVDVRVLLLPSQRDEEKQLLEFWRPYGDVVSKQYVFNFDSQSEGYDSVAYETSARCTIPFKILDVNWVGNVPMCSYSRMQTGNPDGLSLGNINEKSLDEMWNGRIIKQYRDGHRYRQEELVPMCKGCAGRT